MKLTKSFVYIIRQRNLLRTGGDAFRPEKYLCCYWRWTRWRNSRKESNISILENIVTQWYSSFVYSIGHGFLMKDAHIYFQLKNIIFNCVCPPFLSSYCDIKKDLKIKKQKKNINYIKFRVYITLILIEKENVLSIVKVFFLFYFFAKKKKAKNLINFITFYQWQNKKIKFCG